MTEITGAGPYGGPVRAISAVQQMIERDPRGADYPEIVVATDQAAVLARRQLQKRLAAEDDRE